MDDIDEPEEKTRSLYIFGRNVAEIPCFRNSFLYGISGGIGAGLLGFMCTSKPRMGTHIGVGTFGSVTLMYWFYCRIQWSKQRILALQLQEGVRLNTMYEGTDMGRMLSEKYKVEEE